MFKTITILLTGCLLGGGGFYWAVSSPGGSSSAGAGSRSFLDGVAELALRRDRLPPAAPIIEDRLSVYRAAALETNLANLQSALQRAASATWSPARDVEIDANLARISDLDPAVAVALARESALDTRFVADAYLYWAEVDSDAALNELGAIGNSYRRRVVALALVEVLSGGSAALERVAAALPEPERAGLTADWLGKRAEDNPFDAFREAERISDLQVQARAMEQIARAWVEQDPVSATAQADSLPTNLRRSYLSVAFNEWARLDSAGYLLWLESTAAPPEEAMLGIGFLAATDPVRVMSIADSLQGNIGRSMRTMAIQGLAEADLEAAIAEVESRPAGSDRDMMSMAIGAAFARRDPDGALAWAESFASGSRNLMTQVIMAIAENDPDRAVAFLDRPPPGVDPRMVSSLLASTLSRDPSQAAAHADRLVVRDSIQASNALSTLIGNWMQQDPERALEWVLAHESAVNPSTLGNAAQSMARSDPAAAADFVGRIPQAHRQTWVTQVAGSYAASDPAGALAWVGQFQGEAFFDDALREVIAGSAQVDARAAAQLLSQASTEVQFSAAPQVAAAWARQDPRAAARWVTTLAEERVRLDAMSTAISAWAASDAVAARNFTLELDRGEARDRALYSLASRIAASGDFDRSLLDAYSSDSARQEALRIVIPSLSRNSPEEADDLLDLVTNLNTRRQIEEQIERLSALR